MHHYRRVLFLFGATSLFFAVTTQNSTLLLGQTPGHVGPDRLYPVPALTPGKADTVSLEDLQAAWQCPTSIHKVDCTYSQSHRSVSQKVHTKAYDNYNVPQKQRNSAGGEIDHFDPLCNGGSNDISNLWFQPAKNVWNKKNFGYHEKDALETWVCEQVKADKLDPETAFERITSDWVKFYIEVNPKKSKAPE